MISILHLSDLHFGEERSFSTSSQSYLTSKEGSRSLAQALTNNITANDNDTIPDIIIITGDITNTAQPYEFDLAQTFIEELIDILGLNKDRLLIVPGNHDVSWDETEWENSFIGFRSFYRSIFNEDWLPERPSILSYHPPKMTNKLVIFGFNSCYVENKHFNSIGYVSQKQFDYVREWCAKESDSSFIFRYAALHHHVFAVHNYAPSYTKFFDTSVDFKNPPTSIILNTTQVLKVCRQLNISTIFHGHNHLPFSAQQTNFYPVIGERSKLIRPISVIGSGSLSSGRLDHYINNHFQIIKIKGEDIPSSFQIDSYQTKAIEPSIYEMDKYSFLMPIGEIKTNTPPEYISQLRESLNSLIIHETEVDANFENMEEESINNEAIYDNILKVFTNWCETLTDKNMGAGSVARYFKDFNVYKTIAINRFPEEIRSFVYSLDETSLVTEVAKRRTVISIDSRNNCSFAARKRDSIYMKTLQANDQSIIAIPLNSMNNVYPYAIVSFCRPSIGNKKGYTNDEVYIIEEVSSILESTIRQAEYLCISKMRRKLLSLFQWLNTFVFDDIFDGLSRIIIALYNCFELKINNRDAIALILPNPQDPRIAIPVAEKGLGPLASSQMNYRIDSSEGLTGGVINSRKYDYCYDFLNFNHISFRGQNTSGKCQKTSVPLLDHYLTYIGVPLGKGDNEYNKGAIVFNIATPRGQDEGNYIELNYIEPLKIIAYLMDRIIETEWKNYFFKTQKNQN